MKAIGAAAIAGGISPAALFGSGLTTGLFWLLAGVHRGYQADSQARHQARCARHHAGPGALLHGRWCPPYEDSAGPGGYRPGGHLPSSDESQDSGHVYALDHRGWVRGDHEPADNLGTGQDSSRLQAAGFQPPDDHLE